MLTKGWAKVLMLATTTGLGVAAYKVYGPTIPLPVSAPSKPVKKADPKPSVFTAVGFDCDGPQAFQKLAWEAVKHGKKLHAGKDLVCQWQVGDDIELWSVRTKGKKLLHMQPHFAGATRLTVNVQREARQKSISASSGTFVVSALAKTASGVVTDQEFVVDCPGFSHDRRKHYPARATLQLTAVAKDVLHAYPTGSDYLAAAHDRVAYEPGTLVPSALYTKTGEEIPHPKAEGIMASVVVSSKKITNPLTHRSFSLIRVKALGSVVDVVAEPRQLKGEVKKGGILEGSFWFTGRLDPGKYVHTKPAAAAKASAKVAARSAHAAAPKKPH